MGRLSGFMPGVAALTPAWIAGVVLPFGRLPGDLLLLLFAFYFSDVGPWFLARHFPCHHTECPQL
jgi:hypothetical protein